jgi:hypothetical protein
MIVDSKGTEGEDGGVPEEEEGEDEEEVMEDVIHETMFTFEAFEAVSTLSFVLRQLAHTQPTYRNSLAQTSHASSSPISPDIKISQARTR